MLISHAIEQRIVAALVEALEPCSSAFQIFGSWNPADLYSVKNEENPESVAVIAVAVSTPASPTFTAPQQTLSGSIAISVRFDLDPQGSLLLALVEIISNLLSDWQGETYQQAFTALDIVDTESGQTIFSVDEISVESASPILDRDSKITTISIPFTLFGVRADGNNE